MGECQEQNCREFFLENLVCFVTNLLKLTAGSNWRPLLRSSFDANESLGLPWDPPEPWDACEPLNEERVSKPPSSFQTVVNLHFLDGISWPESEVPPDPGPDTDRLKNFLFGDDGVPS